MRKRTKDALIEAYTIHPRLKPWQWAEKNINFSAEPSYEVQRKGMYSSSYMPWWREVCEALQNPNTKEVYVLKNSRAGCSENVALVTMRYHVARKPIPILYITGDNEGALQFFDKRIKLGMEMSAETRKKFKAARVKPQEIYFDNMTIAVGWPSNLMTMKQSGYALIILDEFSLYRAHNKALYEKRLGNWAHSHLFGLSSIDPTKKRPTKKDPIVIEWSRGTQEEWTCIDPATGNPFRWDFGKKDTLHGLKWRKDARDKGTGQWNLNDLDAHYITPDGTRIDEHTRLEVVRAGRWEATNPKAEKGVRSFRSTSFLSPFQDGSFDMITRRFLRAVNSGDPQQMRIFWAEEMAQPWDPKETVTTEDVLMDRIAEYTYLTKFMDAPEIAKAYPHAAPVTICTIDVQLTHLWLVARQWVASGGGHSGLIEARRCETFEEALEICAQYQPERVYVDAAYAKRQQEVYELCATMAGIIPVIGSAKLGKPFRREVIDVFEGSASKNQSGSIARYTIHTDIFRDILADLMAGQAQQKWMIPRGTPASYLQQMTNMQKQEGVWAKTGVDEHFFDCEVLQVFGAVRQRILTWWGDGKANAPEEAEELSD